MEWWRRQQINRIASILNCASGLPRARQASFDWLSEREQPRGSVHVHCQLCARSLSNDEPIFRRSFGYNHPWWKAFGGCIGYVCEECLDRNDLRSSVEWRQAAPCATCHRPVISDSIRNPRVLVCSQKCRRALYVKGRPKRKIEHRACICCGTPLVPKRSNHLYCSPQCKQRHWHQRRRSPTL
jgi:hypothetical protein